LSKQSLGLWLSFFLAILLFAGSASASYREVLPYFVGGSTAESKAAFLSARHPPVALSLQAQRLVLDDCSAALSALIGSGKDEQAAQIQGNCIWTAQDILDEAPIFSYAWYVLALAQSLDGPNEDFQNALSRSQATTANQWAMASLRLWLAFQHWKDLNPELREQMGADIAVLATNGAGRTWLAERYRADELFREAVIDNIETTPANIQRAFVRALSNLSTAQ
jgi:hypothetical protein